VVAAPRGRRRARRLPRTLVAVTAVAALTSAVTWQATGASFGPPSPGDGPSVTSSHRTTGR
jgi:hypothetical protein